MSARLDTLGRRTHWTPTVSRFESRVTEVPGPLETPCWQWDVTHPETGYGTLYDSAVAKNVLAHRWSYEHHVGQIPDGLQTDHLCRNRGCVNPWHLEPVTPRVNSQRGYWATKTECPQGHEYTPENTRRGRKGERICVTCKRARGRRDAARRRSTT